MTKKINKKLIVLLTVVTLIALAVTAYFYFVYVPRESIPKLKPQTAEQKAACEIVAHEPKKGPTDELTSADIECPNLAPRSQ